MRISKRGQITTPKPLRDRGGLPIGKGAAAQHPVDQVYGILDKDALGEGVGVDEYIEKIRDNSKIPVKTALRRSSSC